jgi:hypothetical protein
VSRKRVNHRRSVRVIAAAATAVAVPAGQDFAHAQTPNAGYWNDRKTTVSFEGGFLFSDFRPSTLFPDGSPGAKGLFPTTDGSLRPKKNFGGYGAVSISRDINPDFDWRISAAFNAFRTNSRSATTTSTTEIHSASESESFKFLTVDFDIGRKWENGNLRYRTFAGLRGLRTIDEFSMFDTSTVTKLGTSTTSMTGNSHFTGVGPRVGLDFFYGSKFGLTGSVSAAAIWGTQNSSLLVGTSFPGGGTFSQNRSAWVENISGSLGFQWEFAPLSYLVVGYKADQWWNIRDDFGFTAIDFNRDKDIFSHGPFVRVTIRP